MKEDHLFMYEISLCETKEVFPQALEHWLNSKQNQNSWIRFLFKECEGKVRIFCNEDLSSVLKGSLCQSIEETEVSIACKKEPGFWLSQTKGPLFPIRRYSQFDDHTNKTRLVPLELLIEKMALISGSWCELSFHPLSEKHRARFLSKAKQAWFQPDRNFDQWESKAWHSLKLRRFLGPYIRKSFTWMQLKHQHHEQMQLAHEREDSRQAILDKCSRPLFSCSVKMSHPFTEFWSTLSLPYLGQLSTKKSKSFCLFSSEELASLLNLPRAKELQNRLKTLPTLQLPCPTNALEFSAEDKKRHSYILGKTGMGKSSLILKLIEADLKAGHCFAVIDPHGDLVEHVLNTIPKEKHTRTYIVDPSIENFPIAINPLDVDDERHIPIQCSAVIDLFKALSHGSWGPRLEYILRNALLTLLYSPNTSLLDLSKLLTQKQFILAKLNTLKDPLLRHFWQNEFLNLPEKTRSEYVAPILNKLGPLISNPLLRNCLVQPKRKLRFESLIKPGNIILLPLAKSKLGEECSRLIGMIHISLIQIALLKERSHLNLYIDECHNFATPTLQSMLSESRKFGLGLTLAHQYLDQLEPNLQQAVLGNVSHRFHFQSSHKDAQSLAPSLGLSEEDLTQLPPYHAYIKRDRDGKSEPLFLWHSEKNEDETFDHSKLKEWCIEYFGRPKQLIEVKLAERYNSSALRTTT